MDVAVSEEYIELVRKGLVGPKQERESFLSLLDENVKAYSTEHPLADINDLIVQFGQPEDVAEEFVSMSLDKRRLVKEIGFSRQALMVLVVVAILTTVTIIGFRVWDMWKNENFRDGFFVETVVKDEVSVPLESVPEDGITYY